MQKKKKTVGVVFFLFDNLQTHETHAMMIPYSLSSLALALSLSRRYYK